MWGTHSRGKSAAAYCAPKLSVVLPDRNMGGLPKARSVEVKEGAGGCVIVGLVASHIFPDATSRSTKPLV